MIPQPSGWLRRVAEIVRGRNALLIADEVMTGFGRTHVPSAAGGEAAVGGGDSLLACQQEGVQPDFVALAKGLTGGYLPMAATLTTRKVFSAFLGEYDQFKTFFHGHSYTGNALGAAAALASLRLLQTRSSARARRRIARTLEETLPVLWALPQVGDIRQVGLVVGVELVRHWRTRRPFDLRQQAGIRVCQAMARRGVLTRPIGNVIVLMPPYCSTPVQVEQMVKALHDGIRETFATGG